MITKAIIQARMGSTRLPGKILKKINGITVLECLINQISYCEKLDGIILATTINSEDDIIELFAKKNNIDYFRGNSNDVLDRFYQCAKKYDLENIVRITSDCPLLDPMIADQVIKLFFDNAYEYTNNFFERTFPFGSEVEIFSFEVLEKTWNNSVKLSQREHVTPYIYDNPNLFSIGYLKNNEDLSHLHWAVDRKEDLEFVRLIYRNRKKCPILLNDILEILKKHPHFIEINKGNDPREGYKKSLSTDFSYTAD